MGRVRSFVIFSVIPGMSVRLPSAGLLMSVYRFSMTVKLGRATGRIMAEPSAFTFRGGLLWFLMFV